MNAQIDSPLRIIPRPEAGRARWDAFVDSCDEAWLWHRYDLQDALSTWRGRRDASFAVFDSDSDKIVALFPLHSIEYREAKVLPVAALDSLGGLACKNGLGEKHKAKIWETALEHLRGLAEYLRAVELNVALAPMTPAYRGERCPRVNPLLEAGLENTLTQTWVVDARQGKEALWDGLEKRARNAVRKAEKLGVHIRPAENAPQDLDAYYRLHCETYARTGVRPHPKAYFEAIWRDFLANGLAWIFFALHENEVVAAENFGVYKDSAVYWTGASSAKGLELQASSLIQWTAMSRMAERGIAWYETGEAFPGAKDGKQKGLNDFKRAFGGELYPFYRGRLVFRKGLRALKQSYLLLRESLKEG